MTPYTCYYLTKTQPYPAKVRVLYSDKTMIRNMHTDLFLMGDQVINMLETPSQVNQTSLPRSPYSLIINDSHRVVILEKQL